MNEMKEGMSGNGERLRKEWSGGGYYFLYSPLILFLPGNKAEEE